MTPLGMIDCVISACAKEINNYKFNLSRETYLETTFCFPEAVIVVGVGVYMDC